MSNFRAKKYIYFKNVKTFNFILHMLRDSSFQIQMDYEDALLIDNDTPKTYYYQVKEYLTRIEVSHYVTDLGYVTDVFYLDGREIPEKNLNGMQAFAMLQRMSSKGCHDMTKTKLYDLEKDEWKIPSIGAFNYKNELYLDKRVDKCYAYDLNSAYSWAMLQDIPNTKAKARYNDYIKSDEIGFKLAIDLYGGRKILKAVFNEGEYADFIFKKQKSPFEHFVNHFYEMKKNAKGDNEKHYAKDMLNFVTGYFRRKNPFLHSCIISRVRQKMEALIDENTLICNTDSIFSLVERKDLEVGIDIGQFKVVRVGKLAIAKCGYQWDNDLPKIRGKSKKWFENTYPNGFDILRDSLPKAEANKYYYDSKTMTVIERKQENE